MNRFLSAKLPNLVAAAMVVLFPAAAKADHAVVVGVNQYQSLNGANLKGCVNDAQNIADSLKKYGFQVTLITDADATRQNILDTLQKMQTINKKKERFAFYFAGHGSQSPDLKAVLLPSDAQEDSEAHDLSQQDLYNAVQAIPAKSRTVVLDSCFSGGMSRSFERIQTHTHHHVVTRYHARDFGQPIDPRSKDLVLVNLSDVAEKPSPSTQTVPGPSSPTSSDVCYYTACRKNEQSGEDDFNGQRHGVFTHYLVQKLNGEKDQWGDVSKDVGGKVADYMEDTQHPLLSSSFVDGPVFDNPPKAASGQTAATTQPETGSVWDDYNSDHADPNRVLVTMDPNQTTVTVAQQIGFSIQAKSDGYLVLLERGTSGNLNVLFPRSLKVEAAHVQRGKIITIPEDANQRYAPDAEVTERIKSILFTSVNSAKAFLNAFPRTGSIPWKDSEKLREKARKPAPFYTSDITFEVAPNQ